MLSSLPSSWSLSPNSLATTPKVACTQAMGNGGRPTVRYLTACRGGGNLGPSSFIGRVPVSSSVFPSGLPGATSLSLWGCAGWDDPLDVCPPLCQHSSAFTLLCYIQCIPPSTVHLPELGWGLSSIETLLQFFVFVIQQSFSKIIILYCRLHDDFQRRGTESL